MKIAIIGSRKLNMDISPYIPNNCTEIISGGAEGIDTLAEQYADKHKLSKHIIRPYYAMYGKLAPLKRNEEIIDHADMIIAFWDGVSRGTKYGIDYANKKGKDVRIHLAGQNTNSVP